MLVGWQKMIGALVLLVALLRLCAAAGNMGVHLGLQDADVELLWLFKELLELCPCVNLAGGPGKGDLQRLLLLTLLLGGSTISGFPYETLLDEGKRSCKLAFHLVG